MPNDKDCAADLIKTTPQLQSQLLWGSIVSDCSRETGCGGTTFHLNDFDSTVVSGPSVQLYRCSTDGDVSET